MSIATKNNAIILKDGKLAEGCGCCDEGWYCCRQGFFDCAVIPDVTSVTVTVEAGPDRKRTTKEKYRVDPSAPQGFCPNQFLYRKDIGITQTSRCAGTFQLQNKGGGVWRHDYAEDAAGCQDSLIVRMMPAGSSNAAQWQMELTYHAYGWSKVSTTEPSENKTLSDMKCSTQVVLAGNGCASDREVFTGISSALLFSGVLSGDCVGIFPVSVSRSGSAFVYSAGFSFDEKGPPPSFERNVIEDVGSASITLSLSVSVQR